MTELSPVIGRWYRNETGELFEVVAHDEQDRAIEIQYFDATVEEMDRDDWDQLQIEEAEPPEDWSGSVDVDEKETEELEDSPGEDFDDPLEYLDRND